MKRLSWLLAMLGSLAMIVGCAQQVPSPDLNFETTKKVVLTFRGGEQVVGKIANGKNVELREPGVIWRARVGEVTEEKILLTGLTQVRVTNTVAAQAAREADARIVVGESAPDKTFLRSEITRVETVTFDASRTAQRSTFWAYGAAVLVLLLGAVMRGHGVSISARAVCLSLILVAALAAVAPGQEPQIIGIQELAVVSPTAVFRPLDMLGARAGSKGWAMGGAYVGQADGLDAIAWNPAGLAWSERPALSLDTRWTRCSGTTTGFPDTFNLSRIGQPNLLVARYEVNLKGNLRGNLAGGSYTIDGPGGRRLTGALSFRRYLNVTYPERIVADMVLTQASGFPVTFAVDGKEDGGVDAVAASLAAQIIPDVVTVGANLNLLDGRLKGSKVFETSGGGTGVVSRTTTKFNYKGRSIDLGIQARTKGAIPITAGLRFTPAYTVEVTSGKVFTFTQTLSQQFPGSQELLKIAGYDMEVPSVLSIGGTIDPLRFLTLAFEYDKQAWSETKLTYRDSAFAETQPKPALPLRDTASIHVGMELRVLRPRGFDLPLRFGFYNGPISMANLETPDEFYNYVYAQQPIDKDIKSNGLSMGVGFSAGQIRYDLSYDILDYALRRFYFDDPAPIPSASLSNPNRILVKIDPRRVANLRLTASLAL